MMIIAIDLTSLSYHMTGIERYAACVSEEMIRQDGVNEYILIFRNEIPPTFAKLIDDIRIRGIVLKGNNKLIFYQIVLPFYLYKIKADRYLFFAFTSPILFRKKGIYNTIHDMGAWDSSASMKNLQKLYWRISYKCSASTTEVMITVSEFSKKRISDILAFPKERIMVVPSAVYENVTRDYGCSFEDIRDKYNLPKYYIMTLSTLEPRKNIKLLIESFNEIQNRVKYDLVLVGRKGWMMDEVLYRYNSEKRIHVTGYIKDEHIGEIYRNALCFVFPSQYEGFGLPPVEALALGVPVISSDAASLPEVLMQQAVYFKNNSKEQLKELLLTLEKNVESMPHELNDIQKEKYNFAHSAQRVLHMLNETK